MTNAEETIEAQSNTAALLAESSAKGFIIDPQILQDFIDQYEADVEGQEISTRNKIREALKWDD